MGCRSSLPSASVLNRSFQSSFLLPFHSALSSISFHISPSKEYLLSFLKFVWNVPDCGGEGGWISVTGIWSYPPDTVPVNSDLLCLSCISPELLVFCFLYLNFCRSNLKVLGRFCTKTKQEHSSETQVFDLLYKQIFSSV